MFHLSCHYIRHIQVTRFFNLNVFLLLFMAVPALWAQQPDSTQQLPPAHWMRPRSIDVQHLDIDLRFDWTKKQAYGSTAITLAPLQASSIIALDAGMLSIQSVTLNSGATLQYTYDGGDQNDGLRIQLDRLYAAGETLTVHIVYHTNWVNATDPNNLWGSYGKGLRFFEPSATEPGRRRQIWSRGEPESNRYWFPGYDAPNDFRTCSFRATVDKNLSVISNGQLLRTVENTDGTHTFFWQCDQPHANHQTSFVVGEYVDYQQQFGNVVLHNYGYPDEMAGVEASVARLPDMFRFFTEMTGTPFPYPRYSQVFVQEFPWGGGHNLAASTISENMIDDFGTHADFFYLWDGVEAQDLAAQWFGNLLTPRNWGHAWLSKGFARYFDGLYSEHKNGREEYLLWNRPFEHSSNLSNWQSGIRRPLVTRHYDSPATMTMDGHASIRGAMVLHMLRKQLGDENWWKVIRHYVRTNAGRAVDTEDFRRSVESVTGEPMDWFFDQWVYKTGHPVFAVQQQYDAARRELNLIVRQNQTIDPQNPYPQAVYFQGKMEIAIDGHVQQVWLAPKAENVFVLTSEQAPKWVVFDCEDTWIKELTFEKSLPEYLCQLQSDTDVSARRSAMLALVKLAQNDSTTVEDKARIYAAFREVIKGKSYWRVRYAAIVQLQNLLAPATGTAPVSLDEATASVLLGVIKNEKSWNRAAALTFLGNTRDTRFAAEYRKLLNDSSDRVVNAAANALGKCKAKGAFEDLMKLKDKPSWKNQSLISALNGLKELGDPRGADLAYQAFCDLHSAHWTLGTPVWDYRLAAAETLVALGKGAMAYPVLLERFKKSMADNNVHDIFSNVQMVVTLADPRGAEVFAALKERFQGEVEAMVVVEQWAVQFRDVIK